METLKKYIKNYRVQYINSVILAIIGVITGLIPYFSVSKIVVALFDGNSEFRFYIIRCVVILIALIIKPVLQGISTSVSHNATFQVLRDIRKDLIKKLYRMPLGDVISKSSGKLKDIIVDQVDAMETTLAHLVPEMTSNIIGPILLLIYFFILDWRMALLSIVTFPIGLIFMVSTMKSYPEKYKKSVEVNQNMTNSVVEYINGIEVIKTFNQSEKSYEKYRKASIENASFYYNWMKSAQLGMSAFKAISPASLIVLLPVGYLFYLKGSLDASTLITIIILSVGIIEPILNAGNFIDELAKIGTTTELISEILNSEELKHSDSNKNIGKYDLEFKNVTFAYEKDENVLDGINLYIKENTVNAFVGPSGGGKSTITKLMAGFWDVKNGEVKIGGNNIKDIPLEKLSKLIAYVSQDNYLFDMSVRDNIRIGKTNATNEEVEMIAKQSGCDSFIRNLENGYNTIVGDGGGHLSGGERQRISIARAMLKDAPIVIFDEATAYMDPENEAVIQDSISKLTKGKTIIVVAHRLSTVTDADKIFVVENGRIINEGDHKHLLENSRLYKKMWKSSREVLENDKNI